MYGSWGGGGTGVPRKEQERAVLRLMSAVSPGWQGGARSLKVSFVGMEGLGFRVYGL